MKWEEQSYEVDYSGIGRYNHVQCHVYRQAERKVDCKYSTRCAARVMHALTIGLLLQAGLI